MSEVNQPLLDLLDWINGDRSFAWAMPNKWLADALATERRLTIQQIKDDRAEWFPCTCIDAYRIRQLEDPQCPAHDIDRWLDELAAAPSSKKVAP